jgi:predicted ATPase/class 3 adenylate cyclase
VDHSSAAIMDVDTGIVALLFTDIEGSTEKWEQDPERMADALARHDVLLRATVEAHRGRVIKTTGDGIYAAFADAADCVEAAIAIQQSVADPAATAGMALSVRCGLHAGSALARDNEFFGSTINRAARIMNLAYGGQVLASQAVADLAAYRLPAGSSLLDLGDVRLKGIARSERAYQVVHPSLRQEFPALRSLEATPNNLPRHLTSFIGREREIEEAKELLERSRLLTLLGIGGLGKTRLSLQIGGDVLDSYRDGAWFVDLAPLRDPSIMASEAAKVLGVREEPGRPLIETLCAHLKPRNLLLILDNCEHLIKPSAELVHAILGTAPEIRVIATSREALRVPGEQSYMLTPLAVPNRSDDIEALSRSPAVRLFVERAQLHKPTFALNEQEAPAVAELVARLEGIPLALELAAARMRVLTAAEINVRLMDRYKVLSGGGRVLLERQQTLRALVDWSYDLLHKDEQVLLARLAVFANGFELASAEEVCAADPLNREEVLDLLTSLVEKSLVLADERKERSRYRMLETIRDYAREKLAQRDELAATAARHCNHYFAMAKAANRRSLGHDQAEWTRRIESELDNLRAAIALALAGGVDPIIAVKLEVAMQGFRILRGYSSEGRKNVRAALALPAVEASDLAQGHALYVGAALATGQSDYAEARVMLERSLVLRRGLGNPADIAATLSTLSWARMREGDAVQARACEEEALALFRELGDQSGEAIGLQHLGEIGRELADHKSACRHFEESLAIARTIMHGDLEGECERMLGEVALEEGDLLTARARFTRSLEVCSEAEDKRGEATALWYLGKTDFVEGDAGSARIRLSGALRVFHAFEMRAELLGCLEDHAALARLVGSVEEAVRQYATATIARERLGLMRSPRKEQRLQAEFTAMRESLGDAAFEAAWADGQSCEVEEAIRRALTSVG